MEGWGDVSNGLVGIINMATDIKPGLLNKICARPSIICWVIGACLVDAAVIVSFKDVSFSSMVVDWWMMIWMLAALIPASLLGYLVGMMLCWVWLRPICCRYNSGPLKEGDRVMILVGPLKGTVAEVYEMTKGQGGWDLARVAIGQEGRKKGSDIFNEYSLLKISTSS